MSNSTPAFCANCGAALVAGNAFCEQCGQPVNPSPPPDSTSKPPMRWGLGSLLIIVAASLGVGGVVLWNKMQKTPTATEASVPLKFPSSVTPPVEVAYVHFLDEVHRQRGGEISVGSPHSSATRIEVTVQADGKSEMLVVVEKANTGTQATVIVGPKDAGAIRSYTLKREPNGWVIESFRELDG